jgi:hypothetical protein
MTFLSLNLLSINPSCMNRNKTSELPSMAYQPFNQSAGLTYTMKKFNSFFIKIIKNLLSLLLNASGTIIV